MGAMTMAFAAQSLYQVLKDKEGDALSNAFIAQIIVANEKEPAKAANAATEAVSIFDKLGKKKLAAMSRQVLAKTWIILKDGMQARNIANDALLSFQQLGEDTLSEDTLQIITETDALNIQPNNAQFFVDDKHRIGIIEVNNATTQHSLRTVIVMVHNMQTGFQTTDLKTIILHVEGQPMHEEAIAKDLKNGAFIVGLRTVGVPIIGVVSGTITGPEWHLVLGMDYRVSVADAKLMLPIWNTPDFLPLITGSSCAELCFTTGPLTACNLLDIKLTNEVRPTGDDAKASANEFARRVAAFPNVACRQTMAILPPRAEAYGYGLPKEDADTPTIEEWAQ